MKPLLSREQARRFDDLAIKKLGLSGLVLMENAGRGATDVLEREFFEGSLANKRIVLVCGTGNNGGDGFVVARHALVRGATARVWLIGDKTKLSDDARVNHDAFVGLGGIIVHGNPDALSRELETADAVIDALFGTGLSRTLDESALEIAHAISTADKPVLALDLPSGMNADTGEGPCVRATATVTFNTYKLGLATGQGADHAGDVYVADIGVPVSLVDSFDDPVARFVEDEDVIRITNSRKRDVHKYDKGHVLILGGAPGHTGAPVLSAHAAMRAGAGLVTVATWPESVAAVAAQCRPEMMVSTIEDSLDKLLAKKSACVVGPGLGTDERAKRAIERVLAESDIALVLDADAITQFAGQAARLRSLVLASGVDVVLTPHAGELARLLGISAAEVEADRFAAVQRAAEETAAAVLLKGPFTLVASPREKNVLVGRVGSSLLAVAGSGDSLAGIIAALARGAEGVTQAAAAGAYLHARAAEDMSREGVRGAFAGEIADYVANILASF